VRLALTGLALLYMLLAAFSGHAADVTPTWLSYPIDWLHLVCTAAWAGGIAALAWTVLPRRSTLTPRERAPAVLSLLDRFSPVAYGAVIVLVLSGLYNAVNHLATPATLVNTTYGQLLVLKIALVGVMMLLSASHVYRLRPRIARLQGVAEQPGGGKEGAEQAEQARAGVHEGLATLAARLRLEGGVGAAILLATALMSQTLPSTAVTSATEVALVAAPPSSIAGTADAGDLHLTLTIAPPAVGTSTFTLGMREGKTALTGDTAAAIIHLYPAADPNLRATLDPSAQGTRFVARGSLAATGTWRADVQVRTVQAPDYRTVPFTFTVGAGATFLTPGLNPTAVTIQAAPGLLSAANTLTVRGVQGKGVRLLSQSLDMNMGILPYAATALGAGRWQVRNAFAPMNGRWGLTVQVQAQQDGPWTTLRQFVYQVPLSGPMRLLTPQAATTAAAQISASRPANLSAPFNVAWAEKLPYVALVTEMGSNGIRRLGGPLLHTGVQAHGVDVLDGTPWAYVTNFGSTPGTVAQIDVRTMRVVRTFAVGFGPAHVIFTPDQKRAFVTDFRSSDLYAIDLTTGATHRITFPNDECFEPHGGDISTDGRTLYVACAGGAWIYTVNAVTLQPERGVITAPGAYGVATDAPRHEVWVTDQTVNEVTVLDERTMRVMATIHVGKGPALLAPTPDGQTVYVADQLGNTVSVIDAAQRRVIATIPVAAEPHGPDVTGDGKYVYVPSIGGNAVTIIRTSDNKVVAVVPSAVGSNEVAIDEGSLPALHAPNPLAAP
jgi:YVTN family beta-propeller protein